MSDPKVRVMNGLRVRLPGDARRRAAAVATVDRRMALLEARRAAPASHEVPVNAAAAAGSSSTAEPNPTARPRRWEGVGFSVEDVVARVMDEGASSRSGVLRTTDGTWVFVGDSGRGESMGTVRTERGSSGVIAVPGLRTSGETPVDGLLYLVEPHGGPVRLNVLDLQFPGGGRDLTEQVSAAAASIKASKVSRRDTVALARAMKRMPARTRRRLASLSNTPPDDGATGTEVRFVLRDARGHEHGDAPQV